MIVALATASAPVMGPIAAYAQPAPRLEPAPTAAWTTQAPENSPTLRCPGQKRRVLPGNAAAPAADAAVPTPARPGEGGPAVSLSGRALASPRSATDPAKNGDRIFDGASSFRRSAADDARSAAAGPGLAAATAADDAPAADSFPQARPGRSGSAPDPAPAAAPGSVRKLDGAEVPAPPPSRALPGRPPHDLRGRLARVAGVLGTGAGFGAAGMFLWGPAAGAFYLGDAALQALRYNSDVLGPVGRAATALADRSNPIHLGVGTGLLLTGLFTGNPVLSYFGLTFMNLSAGRMVGRALFNASMKALASRPAAAAASLIDRPIRAAAEALRLRGKAAALYRHRAQIAGIGLSALLSIGSVIAFRQGAEAVMNNAVGALVPANGRLSMADRLRNNLIGAYRTYNLPVGAVHAGAPTQQFYESMKAQYHPQSPEDWANLIDRQVHWTYHAQLYGSPIYYVSSDEAATYQSFGGQMGYFSDCTGKAALLANMLKMDGYGDSTLVTGLSGGPMGLFDSNGHMWVINANAAGPGHELFHYDNTKNLLYAAESPAAHGVRGDNLAAFAAGGVTGVLTQLIYKGLERIGGRRAEPARPTPAPAADSFPQARTGRSGSALDPAPAASASPAAESAKGAARCAT